MSAKDNTGITELFEKTAYKLFEREAVIGRTGPSPSMALKAGGKGKRNGGGCKC